MEKEAILVNELINQKKWRELKLELQNYDTFQLAEIIENIPVKNEITIFRLLDQKKEVFSLLSYEMQKQIIEDLEPSSQKLANLINTMYPDDRTALFEELPDGISDRLIKMLSPKERDTAIKLLAYPEESIGRLMTPEFIAIRADFTVAEAFAHIRKHGQNSETLNVIYIVDEHQNLLDDIRIKELILADPDGKVEDLLDYKVIALNAQDDQESAIRTFSDYDRVALPVLDGGKLVGIVSIDDVMDVVEEESTEDFHKFGAFKEAISNPLKAGVFSLYKNRVIWLVVLVFMNIFSGAAIAQYEDLIALVVPLVFFLPLLIDSGGNAGSQSATLMIRSLAVGDVELGDWYKLIGKEVAVSLLLGVTMAVAVGMVASMRAPELVMVVGITMVLVVLVGSLIGLLLPFIFTKLKLDPATASAPLITSISDIVGVIIYLSVASKFFEIG